MFYLSFLTFLIITTHRKGGRQSNCTVVIQSNHYYIVLYKIFACELNLSGFVNYNRGIRIFYSKKKEIYPPLPNTFIPLALAPCLWAVKNYSLQS